jgi:hypothetical protein
MQLGRLTGPRRMRLEKHDTPQFYDLTKVAMVAIRVVAEGNVSVTAATHFGTNHGLDLGSDLGSPVSLDYYDMAPFKFNGNISTTNGSKYE